MKRKIDHIDYEQPDLKRRKVKEDPLSQNGKKITVFRSNVWKDFVKLTKEAYIIKKKSVITVLIPRSQNILVD
jgi:hypothetical protein